MLALLLSGSLAQAAWPGENGRIFYSSMVTGNGDIYSMNPNGSDKLRLTDDGAHETSVAVSPDGKTIAFERFSGGEQIWLMDADGSNQRPVPGLLNARKPSFSPRGDRIVFIGGFGAVQTIKLDGSDIQTVLAAPSLPLEPGDDRDYWGPVFSFDGSSIVFEVTPHGVAWVRLDRVNIDGSGKETLPIPGVPSQADFAPDGRRIAFSGYDLPDAGPGIRVADLGGDPIILSSVVLGNPFDSHDEPAFSPDGNWIVFTSGGNDHRVMMVDAEGEHGAFEISTGSDDRGPAWAPVPRTPPRLVIAAPKLKPKKVKPGRKLKVSIKVRNDGETEATKVRLCSTLAARARKAFKVQGGKCRWEKNIDPGQTRTVVFTYKTSKRLTKACRSYRLGFAVTGSANFGPEPARAVRNKKVRWPKKAAKVTRPVACG